MQASPSEKEEKQESVKSNLKQDKKEGVEPGVKEDEVVSAESNVKQNEKEGVEPGVKEDEVVSAESNVKQNEKEGVEPGVKEDEVVSEESNVKQQREASIKPSVSVKFRMASMKMGPNEELDPFVQVGHGVQPNIRRVHIATFLRTSKPDIVFAQYVDAPSSENWKLNGELQGYHFIQSRHSTSLAYNDRLFCLEDTLELKTPGLLAVILRTTSTDTPTLRVLCCSWHGEYKITADEKEGALGALSRLVIGLQDLHSIDAAPVVVVIAGRFHLDPVRVNASTDPVDAFRVLGTGNKSDHFLYKGFEDDITAEIFEGTYENNAEGEPGYIKSSPVCADVSIVPQQMQNAEPAAAGLDA